MSEPYSALEQDNLAAIAVSNRAAHEAVGRTARDMLRHAMAAGDALRDIVERAFDPYTDRDLDERVLQARLDWEQRAEDALAEQIDPEHLEALRSEAGGRLAELEDAVADINERLRMAAGDHFTLPPIEVPQPEIDTDAQRQALVSFDDDWAAATRALIARKAYGGGAA